MTIYDELQKTIKIIRDKSYAYGKLCLTFKHAGQRYIDLEQVRLGIFKIELKDSLYHLEYKSKYREGRYKNMEVIDDDIVYYGVGEQE